MHDQHCEGNTNIAGLCNCGLRSAWKASYVIPKDIEEIDAVYVQKIKSLEAERDSLRLQFNIVNDHLQKMQITNGSLTGEIDRLKAEMDKTIEAWQEQDNKHLKYEQELEFTRDLWKQKAETLAKAIRKHNCNNGDDVCLEVAIDKYEQETVGK